MNHDTVITTSQNPFLSPFDQVITSFRKITKKYFFFHCAFALLLVVEALSTLFFFSSFITSSMLGIAISLLFFTLLLYFILRLYSNEQKPQELQAIIDNYLAATESQIASQSGESDLLFYLSEAAHSMAKALDTYPITLYSLPENITKLFPQIEKLHFGKLLHKQDKLALQERLLLAAINKRMNLVEHAPTSPEVHALLADSFLELAAHYETAKNGKKYTFTLMNALEELKIVDAFDPQNIDIHLKLAFCYKVLKMTSQEIHEYETILKLEPKNSNVTRNNTTQQSSAQIETLYTLGLLYFRTGEKAKGLRVYERLKKSQPTKAAQLIHHYGVLKP